MENPNMPAYGGSAEGGKTRYLYPYIAKDLVKKMVFVGGPRQVGKTTLAKLIGKGEYQNPLYLNWDNRDDRKKIIAGQLDYESDLLIFDEIHKYKQWKNYLKGEFDKNKDKHNYLITGSARLDLYRRGGDSLLGRYHYYRLHPFSLREALGIEPNLEIGQPLKFVKSEKIGGIFRDLLAFGGFPEPFLEKNEITARRFHSERIDRLVREDIRDLEAVRDISALQILAEILPSKVGSLFSLNALREDFGVAHKTISLWVEILERFYYHFRIYPFTSSVFKSLRKEPKIYLWDWSQLEDRAAKLENIVASHLLKAVHFLRDVYGYKTELYFLRDRDGKEVDFLVTVDRKPWFAAEVKSKDKTVSKNLIYFAGKLRLPYAYQITEDDGVDFEKDNVRVVSASKFLSGLV
ncbi:ATP-binding protein [Patescibacteria group bacterium]|nr:ATP-binding protein [Patescibacteria group bacterium]MBU4057086.1 ATP-binding protein [Patescibacteria group bacterium]MBU4368567.1 ATP-binding protein [Patescibacteria group bacterium]